MNPKLKDLLEVSGTGFKTTQTKVDPNTGRIEWDVEYFPDFSEILSSLNDLINGLDGAIKKHSIKDQEILTSSKALKSIKSILMKTLELKHPEYIKNYQNKK